MVLACSAAIAFAGCTTMHHAAPWDYKIVEGNNVNYVETELNKLGSNGWIIVSSSSSAKTTATSIDFPDIVVILKRHK